MNSKLLSGLAFVGSTMILFLSCKLSLDDPPCPKLINISPKSAMFDSLVTITGENFLPEYPNIYKIRVAGQTVNVNDLRVLNTTTLTFRVPRGMPDGKLTVSVSTKEPCDNSSSINFTYIYSAPLVNSLLDPSIAILSASGLDLNMNDEIVVACMSTDSKIKVIRPARNGTGYGDRVDSMGRTNGAGCSSGTPIPKANALFYFPSDVAVSSTGKIYVTCPRMYVIQVINPNGIVELFAGNCLIYGTNQGPRLTARLAGPTCIDEDIDGALYFTDAGSIRKIDVNGTVSLLAAKQPSSSFKYLAISHSRPGVGPIYVVDSSGGSTLKSINTLGAIRNINLGANVLNDPSALAIDSRGNIFIADRGKNKIFVLYTDGTFQDLAGTGDAGDVFGIVANTQITGKTAKFKQPSGIAIDEKKE